MSKLKNILKDYYEINAFTGLELEDRKEKVFDYTLIATTLGDYYTGFVKLTTDQYDRLQVQFKEQGHSKQRFYIDVHSHVLEKLVKSIKNEFSDDNRTVEVYGGFLVFDDIETNRFVFLKYNVMESEPALVFVVK